MKNTKIKHNLTVGELCKGDYLSDALAEKLQKLCINHRIEKVNDFLRDSSIFEWLESGEISITEFHELRKLFDIVYLELPEKHEKHHTRIYGYKGDLKGLAYDIIRLRFDYLSKLLGYLAHYSMEESKADAKRLSLNPRGGNRSQLSDLLKVFATKLCDMRETMKRIWKISKPYMKDELKESGGCLILFLFISKIDFDFTRFDKVNNNNT